MQFEIFLLGLVFNLIAHESFYGVFLEAKLAPDLWPLGRARTLAEAYTSYRVKDSHGAAVAHLHGEMLSLRDHEEIVFDADALRTVFAKRKKTFLVELLIGKLKTEPDRASDHIRAFEEAQTSGSQLYHLGNEIENTLRDLVERSDRGETMRPITGYPFLTDMVSGFNPERFSLFIAKSGFGKTTALVNLSLAASKTMSVFYVNMEMSKQDFMERALCAQTGIRYDDLIKDPRKYAHQIGDAEVALVNRDFYFSDGRALSLGEIKAEAMIRKKKTGLDFMVVDYDQKIDLRSGDEEWKAVQNATKFFEDLAKELHCYIILLAQEGDGGDISSSKRAKFVATTVFRFFEHEERDTDDGPIYLIKTLKNRYGRNNSAIRMNYHAEKLQLKEIGPYNEKHAERSFTKSDLSKLRTGPKRVYNPGTSD